MTAPPLEWSDPPAEHGIWSDVLAPCVEQPGRWALVQTFTRAALAYSTAKDLRRRRYRYQPGVWEFRSRRRGGDTGLWARYVGPA